MSDILVGIEKRVGRRKPLLCSARFQEDPMRSVLFALLLPCAALAQTAPPPPPMDDAKTRTTLVDDRADGAEDRAAGDAAAAAGPAGDAAGANGPALREEAPLPEKILEPPPPEAAPAVSIRTDGRNGDVVEEYRQNGKIYMVKVRPRSGVPYTLLDTNGDGMLDQHDGDGPVRPVYYTLYEWN
jgi:hypothetical protein